MKSNPFQLILVFIVGTSLLAATRYARSRGTRELPSILARLGWAAIAGYGLVAKGTAAFVISLATVMVGIVVGEATAFVRTRILRARTRGDYARARTLAMLRVPLAPLEIHRLAYRAYAELRAMERGRRAPSEVRAWLNRRLQGATFSEFGVLLETSTRTYLHERDWVALGASFDRIRAHDAPLPAPAAFAFVTAFATLGRFVDAVSVLDYLDRKLAAPGAPRLDPDELDELDDFRTKACVVLLAHSGRGALLDRLRASGGPLDRLFSAGEAAALHEASSREPPVLDRETRSFVDAAAANLVAESQLPDTAASIAPPPRVTIAIAVVCTLVYVCVALSSPQGRLAALMAPSDMALLRWGAFQPELVLHGEAFRLFTCTLLHANLFHLLMNMRALLPLGRVVEQLLGSLRLSLVYGVAGIAGSVACLVTHEAHMMVGASGAVCGLLGASVAVLRWRKGSLPAAWHDRQSTRYRGYVTSIIVFGMLFPLVSNAAHGGGFVAGALLATGLCWIEDRFRPSAPAATAR